MTTAESCRTVAVLHRKATNHPGSMTDDDWLALAAPLTDPYAFWIACRLWTTTIAGASAATRRHQTWIWKQVSDHTPHSAEADALHLAACRASRTWKPFFAGLWRHLRTHYTGPNPATLATFATCIRDH